MRFKYLILMALSVCIATSALILVAEVALYGAWKLSGSTKLDTLYGNSIYWERWRTRNTKYPDAPEKFLKIAVYGGSSAEGASAERNLADVIKLYMEKTFGKNVYVRNYAKSGNSFYREQAEILKSLLPYYDISIVYAGNNEWVPPFNDAGGTRLLNIKGDEKKSAAQVRKRIERLVGEVRNQASLFAYLHENSRLYALAWKIGERLKKYLPKIRSTPSQNNIVLGEAAFDTGILRPPQNASEPVISKEALAEIPINFAKDLKEIKIAADARKIVIVIGARGDEMWPPYFSVHPSGWDAKKVRDLDDALERVTRLLSKENLSGAHGALESIIGNAPDHAYANFLMGQIYMKQGEWEKAWRKLERAVDGDGFPHRGISAISSHSRKVSALTPQTLIYIDHIRAIRRLIADGMPVRLLMADWVHPNTLGHIVIGRHALCALSNVAAYSQLKSGNFCEPLDGGKARQLLTSLSKQMRVRSHDFIQAKQPIYRWAVLLARISAHPRIFYKVASEHLKYAYPNFNKSKALTARVLTLKAFFLNLRRGNCKVIKAHLGDALRLDPKAIVETLANPFPFPANGYDIVKTLLPTGLSIVNDQPVLSETSTCY